MVARFSDVVGHEVLAALLYAIGVDWIYERGAAERIDASIGLSASGDLVIEQIVDVLDGIARQSDGHGLIKIKKPS